MIRLYVSILNDRSYNTAFLFLNTCWLVAHKICRTNRALNDKRLSRESVEAHIITRGKGLSLFDVTAVFKVGKR